MFRGFACKIAVGDGEPKLAAVKLKALQYCTIKKEKSKAVWRLLLRRELINIMLTFNTQNSVDFILKKW